MGGYVHVRHGLHNLAIDSSGGSICQREYVMLVAKKKMCGEERYARMAISYARHVFTAGFSARHAYHLPIMWEAFKIE